MCSVWGLDGMEGFQAPAGPTSAEDGAQRALGE